MLPFKLIKTQSLSPNNPQGCALSLCKSARTHLSTLESRMPSCGASPLCFHTQGTNTSYKEITHLGTGTGNASHPPSLEGRLAVPSQEHVHRSRAHQEWRLGDYLPSSIMRQDQIKFFIYFWGLHAQPCSLSPPQSWGFFSVSKSYLHLPPLFQITGTWG
jgi:hypothetical protein